VNSHCPLGCFVVHDFPKQTVPYRSIALDCWKSRIKPLVRHRIFPLKRIFQCSSLVTKVHDIVTPKQIVHRPTSSPERRIDALFDLASHPGWSKQSIWRTRKPVGVFLNPSNHCEVLIRKPVTNISVFRWARFVLDQLSRVNDLDIC
jgi:hypothetical protein